MPANAGDGSEGSDHRINAFYDVSHKKETAAAEALARRRGTALEPSPLAGKLA
jgi:hypothetical protein